MKSFSPLLAALSLLALQQVQAQAGTNDFFGNTLPAEGTASSQAQAVNATGNSPSSGAPAYPGIETESPSTPGTATSPSTPKDFSDDEKRMQKKYKNLCKYYQALILKGDKMMKDGEKANDKKMLSKGRIFKETGEKHLAEMQANNPLPDAPKPLPEKKEPEQ
jgi:hypothetical protein